MSARPAFADRAKNANEASRQQLYAYVGANDYLYEQVRRSPASLQDLQGKLGQVDLKSYTPTKIRESVQERIESVRGRRDEFANRGKNIVADWHQATAVKDGKLLIKSIREADGASGLAKSLKTWFADFPSHEVSKPSGGSDAKAATKTTARKPAATKPASV
jgi:hypothetical protein